MIELGRHIEILLLSNDCVIVPELGGFMAHHRTARYDNEDSLFLPPLRSLGFNPQLKLNDSLLAQSYIEAYDISYPEAIRRIEEEVNELKQHLNNEGKYELNDIGTLYLNEDGIYLFEPCEAGILTPDLYGLSSFEMKRIENAETTGCETAQQAAGQEVKPEPVMQTAIEPEDDDDDSSIRIKIAWIRNAISVAAAIIAFLFITTPISNSEKSNVVVSGMTPPTLLSSMQQDQESGSGDIDPVKIKEAIKARTDSAAIAKTNAKPDTAAESPKQESKNEYCIVLASRVTKQNADVYVKELHSKGYEEAYTYINNNIVRVVYGSYEKESDAYSALRNIRGNKYFEQSWVYKKR